MPALTRSRLTLLAVVAALAGGLPACATDDAVEKDAKDAQQDVDREAGSTDEKAAEDAKEAGEDAGSEAEKAIEDVDGN